MEPIELVLQQHRTVHSAESSEGRTTFSLQDLILGGLSDEQLRLRPAPGQNSVAWLIWHMTRGEDVAVNVAIAGQPQVWDDGWGPKMGVDRDDIGTGMTAAEVGALSERIDLVALLEYRHAVAVRTQRILPGLDGRALEERVEPSRWEAVRPVSEHAGWLRDFWAPWRVRDFLFLPTGHCYVHWGEAMTLRSLGGFALGL